MSRLTHHEDGTVSVGEDTFNRYSWEGVDMDIENPFWRINGKTSPCKNKRDLAWEFQSWGRKFECNEDLERKEDEDYRDHASRVAKWRNEYLESLGFEFYNTNQWHMDWSYVGWKHKLKVDELRDLFVQKFTPYVTEELKQYEERKNLGYEKNYDSELRQKYVDRLQLFLDFKNEWKSYNAKMHDIVNKTRMQIGKGNFRGLAYEYPSHNNGHLVPECWRKNHFFALDFAEKWIKVFSPIVDEIDDLESVLKFPYKVDFVKGEYDTYRITDLSTKKHQIDLEDLVSFRFQDFLTWLVDFKKRFGDHKKEYRNWGDDRLVSLGGWNIYRYEYDGEYRRRDTDVADWDFFELIKPSGYQDTTWGRFVEGLALNGSIRAISDPVVLMEITSRLNSKRHRDNEEKKRYQRAKQILVIVGNPLSDDEEVKE
tara:strand:+ start:432 stop:1709 length:1278 start_codon:yes stop_codon:yes gene_type:complete